MGRTEFGKGQLNCSDKHLLYGRNVYHTYTWKNVRFNVGFRKEKQTIGCLNHRMAELPSN